MKLDDQTLKALNEAFETIKNADEKSVKRAMDKIYSSVEDKKGLKRAMDNFSSSMNTTDSSDERLFSDARIQDLMLDRSKKYTKKGFAGFGKVKNDHYVTTENIGDFIDSLQEALEKASDEQTLEAATERMLIMSTISGVVKAFDTSNVHSRDSKELYKKKK